MNAQLLQLVISILGIALMCGFCWLLFGHRDVALADAAQVTRELAREVPGFRAGRVALSRDARAALVESGSDVYLAVVRGDGLVTRKLARGTSVAREGDSLALGLRDFTLKRATLELDDAQYWEARLGA
jgi:hypothetical protein